MKSHSQIAKGKVSVRKASLGSIEFSLDFLRELVGDSGLVGGMLATTLAFVTPAIVLAQAAPKSLSTADIAVRGIPSTMTIVTSDPAGNPVKQGSAFVVRPGVIATNWHVIDGASAAQVQLKPDGARVNAVFLAADAPRDVALLAIPTSFAAPLRTAAPPRVGERVVAIGSPLGLSATVTEGIVSAVRAEEGRELIQISAALSHGSSGGPVFDGSGRVFGIATAVLEEGQSLNFATPVSYALNLLSDSLRPKPFPSPTPRPPTTITKAPFPQSPPVPSLDTSTASGAQDGRYSPPHAQPAPSSLRGTYRLFLRTRTDNNRWTDVALSAYPQAVLDDVGGWIRDAESGAVHSVDHLELNGNGEVSFSVNNRRYTGYATDSGFVASTRAEAGGVTKETQILAVPDYFLQRKCQGTFNVSGTSQFDYSTWKKGRAPPADSSTWSGQVTIFESGDSAYSLWRIDSSRGDRIHMASRASRGLYATNFWDWTGATKLTVLTNSLLSCPTGPLPAWKPYHVKFDLQFSIGNQRYWGHLGLTLAYPR